MNSESENKPETRGGAKAAWVLLAVAAILASASIGYNILSSAEAPPDVEAGPDAPPSIETLRAAAEGAEGDFDDWTALAFAHFQRDEFADAATAYERALEINPDDAVIWSALGEARLYAEDAATRDADPLPKAAMDAFRKAVELDPSDPRARYFLATEADMAGRHEEAITSWLALLAESPVGAPWERDLIRTIEQVGQINDID
ncbi:MAG: tetratricopeptide repeat protein, partial [Pseudomonadota bacterium]